MVDSRSVTAHRGERILAFVVGAAAGLSILCIIALIIGQATGAVAVPATRGLWQVVAVLPIIGLPIAFVLMVVLLVVSIVRRTRASRDA
jgi:hypothetical protein